MTSDLRSLAVNTFPCPFGHISSHGGPNELGCNRLSGAVHAGVPEAMDNVEDASAPGVGNVWPCRTIRDVHDKDFASNVHLSEIQSRSRFVCEALIVRIQCLFSRQLLQIDAIIVYGCDDGDQVFKLIIRKGSI